MVTFHCASQKIQFTVHHKKCPGGGGVCVQLARPAPNCPAGGLATPQPQELEPMMLAPIRANTVVSCIGTRHKSFHNPGHHRLSQTLVFGGCVLWLVVVRKHPTSPKGSCKMHNCEKKNMMTIHCAPQQANDDNSLCITKIKYNSLHTAKKGPWFGCGVALDCANGCQHHWVPQDPVELAGFRPAATSLIEGLKGWSRGTPTNPQNHTSWKWTARRKSAGPC